MRKYPNVIKLIVVVLAIILFGPLTFGIVLGFEKLGWFETAGEAGLPVTLAGITIAGVLSLIILASLIVLIQKWVNKPFKNESGELEMQ